MKFHWTGAEIANLMKVKTKFQNMTLDQWRKTSSSTLNATDQEAMVVRDKAMANLARVEATI